MREKMRVRPSPLPRLIDGAGSVHRSKTWFNG
jgi:hypothetical protein